MSNWKQRLGESLHWKNLLQYFFQGIVIIAPLGITIYAVYWLFTTIDSILPNILQSLFPRILDTDTEGLIKQFPGIGFIVVVLIVILIGRVSSSFVMSKLVDLLDSMLERTPGIKFIYKSVKDFLEAFTGYALTGVTYFVAKEKIKQLHHISSAEAMKFAVSGGVSHVEEK